MRCLYLLTAAVQAATVLATPGSVCYSGLYGALLPLAGYGPAQEFCSKYYPIPAVTVTAKDKRCVRRSLSSSDGYDDSLDARSVPLDKLCDDLKKAAASIARTACSCIQTTKTVTVKPTTKPTSKTTAKTTPAKTTPAKTTPVKTTTTGKSTTQSTPTSTLTTTKSTTVTTTPAVTTPVITTPEVTTPVITTPATTTPETTTPVTTTSATPAPVGCTPSVQIVEVLNSAGAVSGYLQNVDTPGALLVARNLASATPLSLGDGRLTRCTAAQVLTVALGTAATYSEPYFNTADSELVATNALIAGVSGNAVTLADRINGNSLILDCFDQIYLVDPATGPGRCNVVTLRLLA